MRPTTPIRSLACLAGLAATVAIGAATATADGGLGDETATATLRLGTVGGGPGDVVRVPLRMDSNDLVGAFLVDFEAAGATIESIDYNGPLFLTSWGAWDTAPSTTVQVSAACTFPEDQVVADDVLVFELLVRIPDDAVGGSTIPVTMPTGDIWNYGFTNFALTLEAGEIVIESGSCAEDVDGTGTVDFGDVLAVLGSWGPCDGCAADLDGDGTAGLSDLVSILAAFGDDCG